MITIKEYIKKVKCPNCDNKNVTRFELYFVGDRESINQQFIVTKYLSCLECGTVYKIDDHDKTKEYLLEPVLLVGG